MTRLVRFPFAHTIHWGLRDPHADRSAGWGCGKRVSARRPPCKVPNITTRRGRPIASPQLFAARIALKNENHFPAMTLIASGLRLTELLGCPHIAVSNGVLCPSARTLRPTGSGVIHLHAAVGLTGLSNIEATTYTPTRF